MSERTAHWNVPKSEVYMPPPSGLAGVIVIGLFALSLSGVGILYEVIRRIRR